MQLNWYPVIREYYLEGLYTTANLIIFVTAGMITQDQMDQLVAEKAELDKQQKEE